MPPNYLGHFPNTVQLVTRWAVQPGCLSRQQSTMKACNQYGQQLAAASHTLSRNGSTASLNLQNDWRYYEAGGLNCPPGSSWCHRICFRRARSRQLQRAVLSWRESHRHNLLCGGSTQQRPAHQHPSLQRQQQLQQYAACHVRQLSLFKSTRRQHRQFSPATLPAPARGAAVRPCSQRIILLQAPRCVHSNRAATCRRQMQYSSSCVPTDRRRRTRRLAPRSINCYI